MGRKNLSLERQTQLLDAFEACIVRDGLAGASLQRVADEAAVKLSVIHHYIGNRQDLIDAMIARFIQRYRTETQVFLGQLPQQDRLSQLLDFYFSETGIFYRADNTIILNELMALSDRDPAVKTQLRLLYAGLYADFETLLSETYPDREAATLQAQAHNLLSLWVGHATLRWLGFAAATDADARAASTVLHTT